MNLIHLTPQCLSPTPTKKISIPATATHLKSHQRHDSKLITAVIQDQLKANGFDKSQISEDDLNLLQSQRRHFLREYEKQISADSSNLASVKKNLMFKFVTSQFTTSLTNKYRL